LLNAWTWALSPRAVTNTQEPLNNLILDTIRIKWHCFSYSYIFLTQHSYYPRIEWAFGAGIEIVIVSHRALRVSQISIFRTMESRSPILLLGQHIVLSSELHGKDSLRKTMNHFFISLCFASRTRFIHPSLISS
jgi:hypothetical protein